MSIPRYSPQGLLRSMQASATPLFLFVEGKDIDPYFADRLMKSTELSPSQKWEIKRSFELEDQFGQGKKALKQVHSYLQTTNCLSSNFKGKKTQVIFLLDKDIDDECNSLINCPHIIYTKNYNVESELFNNGSLLDSVCASISMEPSRLKAYLGTQKEWMRKAHETITEWIILCYFIRLHDVSCRYGYGQFSKFHDHNSLRVSKSSINRIRSEVRSASRFSSKTFNAEIRRIRKITKDRIKNDLGGTIFNGRWYGNILRHTIKSALGAMPHDSDLLERKTLSCLLLSIDFSATWAADYRDSIRSIVN